MELKKIAILGPGGNVGNSTITELLKDGQRFDITAITRQTSTYTPPPDSTIIHKQVDYTSLSSLVEAFSGQDAVVNCITGGATHYEPSKLIIDAAIAAGVKFYFANEFVGHIMREQFKRMPEAFVGAKIRIREYLEELGKDGKIAWTSLTGGPFFDMWLMKGPAGFDVANRRARIYGTGNNNLCWTPLSTMGLAVANMLRHPEPIINRPIYIFPFPKLSQNIILSTLESVLGTKFTVENVDVKKINENSRLALEKGEAAKAMKGLAVSNQFFEGDSGNDFRDLVENETVGVETMSVEDGVRAAIATWGEDFPVVQGMFRVEPCEV
ncbi:NAD(P)-binding protein [Dothidotthia symphoricarpi CBS 119687]|uniref:NAD(P)-binding protein n=1 Tax=Dothidotthia symphoricarpi CBS 119687 TaxID=1392245 RepID=A0A6A6AUC6_9PLEO|nr:NAD(P)-binding protein [Dothidotthia symphoricarpi CBS 119687]KAF2134798.1 NAD(P)-binding protein [Dothidotthia symphoricarpi CBS 119687]